MPLLGWLVLAGGAEHCHRTYGWSQLTPASLASPVAVMSEMLHSVGHSGLQHSVDIFGCACSGKLLLLGHTIVAGILDTCFRSSASRVSAVCIIR
jgi:hypothetical protein